MSNDSISNNIASFDDLFNSGNTIKKVQKSPGRTSIREPKENLSLSMRLTSLIIPTVPPVIAKPNIATISELFSELREAGKVDAIGALPRDKLDDRAVSAKSKSVATLTTNHMEFFSVGKDGDFIAQVRTMLPANYDEHELGLFVDAVEDSMSTIGSSGTMVGLISRLKQGMLSTPNLKLDRKQCAKWANSMVQYTPVEFDYREKSITEVVRTLYDQGKITFNKSSSAGIPYNKSTGSPGVFKEALSVSELIFDSIATGKYADLMGKERKALLGVMLKNKQDYYKIDQLQTKVRPYFVYGLHERFLYTALQSNLKAVRFDEPGDGPKGSAVGFSWNYGGGDRLYDWVSTGNEPGTFRSIFYGDDQLWVVTLADGTVYVVTPDFSHMDLSLVSDWATVAYDVWKPAFKKVDKTWSTILKLNCKRAFIRPVVVEGPLTYQFKQGMASGIPGTTKFDEVASATVNGYIQEQFMVAAEGLIDKSDLVQFFLYMSAEVKRIFGLTFKENSLDPYLFEAGEPHYPFIFLGQSLKRIFGKDRQHYVPVPVLTKLVVSASTFKKRYKSAVLRQRATMEKVRSLYAGGGLHYPAFADRLQAYYTLLEKRNISPLTPEDDGDEYASETESSAFVSIMFPAGDASFPTYEWSLNLYLPVDDQLDEYSGLSRQDIDSNPASKHAIDLDIGIDEFDSGDTDTSNESDEYELEKEDVVRPPPRPTVTRWKPPPIKISSPSVETKIDFASAALNSKSWADREDEERRRLPSGAVVDKGLAEAIELPKVSNEQEMFLIQSKYTPAQKEAHRKAVLADRAQKRADKQVLIDRARASASKVSIKGKKNSKGGTSKKIESIRSMLFEHDDDDDFEDFSE